MAYSTNPITVERMLPYMEPLKRGEECTWQITTNLSRWLAYRLREALAVARLRPDVFPELAQFADLYRIEVTGPSSVRAMLRAAPTIELSTAPSEPARTRMDMRPATEVNDVKHHWHLAQDAGQEKLYLPNANLSREDLLDLYEWGQEKGVIFFENTGALTLVRMTDDLAPLAWNPNDEEL